MSGALRALIWDLDGTIAETEHDGHRVAFNLAFDEAGLSWHWDAVRYGELLHVIGGRERLLHFMRGCAEAPRTIAGREALAKALHMRKNVFYAELVGQGRIQTRPGVRRLMDECGAAGIAMAVATTTSTSNAHALFRSLLGEAWHKRFATVVCAEDALRKKPDPHAYQVALQRLGVAPREAFALEDSPNGLHAAMRAGLRCGVTRSAYFIDADFSGARWVRDDLDTPTPIGVGRLRQA